MIKYSLFSESDETICFVFFIIIPNVLKLNINRFFLSSTLISFSSNTMRPQSMVGASRLVSSCDAKDSHNRRSGEDSSAGDGDRRALGICVTGLPMRSTGGF